MILSPCNLVVLFITKERQINDFYFFMLGLDLWCQASFLVSVFYNKKQRSYEIAQCLQIVFSWHEWSLKIQNYISSVSWNVGYFQEEKSWKHFSRQFYLIQGYWNLIVYMTIGASRVP